MIGVKFWIKIGEKRGSVFVISNAVCLEVFLVFRSRQFLLTRWLPCDTTGCCILRCWLAPLFYMLPCRIILYGTPYIIIFAWKGWYNHELFRTTKTTFFSFFPSQENLWNLIGENIKDLQIRCILLMNVIDNGGTVRIIIQYAEYHRTNVLSPPCLLLFSCLKSCPI